VLENILYDLRIRYVKAARWIQGDQTTRLSGSGYQDTRISERNTKKDCNIN
jgi:hypothetical protein